MPSRATSGWSGTTSPLYTQPVEELTPADGRTRYAKGLPNDYPIRVAAGGGSGSMAPLDAV